jgi:hypothetical protein
MGYVLGIFSENHQGTLDRKKNERRQRERKGRRSHSALMKWQMLQCTKYPKDLIVFTVPNFHASKVIRGRML